MRLGKNWLLVGVGVAAAAVIAVAASAQDQAPAADDAKAQLDRTFGDEPEGTGGAGQQGTPEEPLPEATGGAADAGMGRMRALDAGAFDGGMRMDGGTRMGRDGGMGGAGTEGTATEEDHTNIILYGPNGIPAESMPQTPEAAGGAAAGEGDAVPEQQ